MPSSLAFAVRVHTVEQFPLLDCALFSLRLHYSAEPVFVIGDGLYDAATKLESLAGHHGADTIITPACKRRECGGEYVQWWYDLWRHAATTHFVKFDPDTRFWRPLENLPKSMGLYGSVQTLGPLTGIQGGCVMWVGAGGFPTRHDEAFREALLEPDLAFSPGTTWEPPEVAQYTREQPNIAEDWVLAWAAREADIAVRPYDEISSHWGTPPTNDILDGTFRRYAVTHPHKTPDFDTGTPSGWLQ